MSWHETVKGRGNMKYNNKPSGVDGLRIIG